MFKQKSNLIMNLDSIENIDDITEESVNARKFRVELYEDNILKETRSRSLGDFFKIDSDIDTIRIDHITGKNQYGIALHSVNTGIFLDYIVKDAPGDATYSAKSVINKWNNSGREFAISVVQIQ